MAKNVSYSLMFLECATMSGSSPESFIENPSFFGSLFVGKLYFATAGANPVEPRLRDIPFVATIIPIVNEITLVGALLLKLLHAVNELAVERVDAHIVETVIGVDNGLTFFGCELNCRNEPPC